MKSYLTALLFLLFSTNLVAGSPGGITLLVRPLSSGEDFKYIIDGFFRNYYGPDNVKTPVCNSGDYIPYVDNVYLNTIPSGISDNVLAKSISSFSERKKIAGILSEFKDDKISGFDGIMFYELKENGLVIYTFDSRSFKDIYTARINIHDLIYRNVLGEVLCQSISSKILPANP
ncbi:hypothetical protein EH228_13235 [Erwinia endophytica]|uniref:hypothetical protein n=1 Tax=Erwinia endophytica TaxID=1563158 RepID=UPI001265FDBB|nr:hypothetical protein [Erwinia endophytica]KAB8308352.1 hypothetical protein EH228_13235 [Erwinia endophytica]